MKHLTICKPPEIKVLPHPPDILAVEPQIIATMTRRLSEDRKREKQLSNIEKRNALNTKN